MSPVQALSAQLMLDDGDLQFRDRFRMWLADHAPDAPPPTERRERYAFARRWQRTMAEHGWAGVTWPKSFGGMGVGPVQQYLYYEELGRVYAPEFPNRPGLILLAPTLMTHGTQEIQRRYLPGMLTADEIWAQGFSEPGAGSDLASVRTTATLDNGTFRLDGQKTWVTAGDLATHGAIVCRTGDPEARYRTLTLVLIELDQPGVEIRPIRTATGDTEFCEIFFDGAQTPASHAIGGVNGGWAAAMTMLEYERGDATFTDHRPILAQIDRTWCAVESSEQSFGATMRTDELKSGLAFALARAYQLRELNISLMYRRASGDSIGFWGSPVKVFWAQLNQLVHKLALDASDLTPGLEFAELGNYLASRMSTVYSGAIDIQHSVVAERLLGLPRSTSHRARPGTIWPGGS